MTATPPFNHPDANCLGANTNLFFPEQGEPHDQTRKALECCAECPTACRKACLDHAITYREPGIWGGTTGKQRRHMIRYGLVDPPERRKSRGAARPPGQTKNQLLEELRVRGDEWTPMAQLVDIMGVTRQSVFRALQQLIETGHVEHDYGHYRLTHIEAPAEVT